MMVSKSTLLSLIVVGLPAFVSCQYKQLPLWPTPTEYSGEADKFLKLSYDFRIVAAFENVPSDLEEAIQRTTYQLLNDKLGYLNVDRGASFAPLISAAKELSTLTLILPAKAPVTSISQQVFEPLIDWEESYTLSIPADGTGATIQANTTLGLFRGLATFTQFWFVSPVTALIPQTIYTPNASLVLTDSPLYPYRGVLLDTARNYYGVESILLVLDGLSYMKGNVLQLHITDSQSFPLQVPSYMELSQYGAYMDIEGPQLYSIEDIQGIVAYAAKLGITVVPELDIPGHSTSWCDAPVSSNYCACNNYPWEAYANEPPAGQLRFAVPEVRNFVAGVFQGVVDTFKGSMAGTGGDEINMPCYEGDNITQLALQSSGLSFNESLNLFLNTTHKVIEEANKRPLVWEEAALDFNLTFSNQVIVEVWIEAASAVKAINLGYDVVLAFSTPFYLDCGQGAWLGKDPAGDSWCDFNSWSSAYSLNQNDGLTEAQSKKILGLSASLWSEQSSDSNVIPQIFPRSGSVLEISWSNGSTNGEPRDLVSALPRLHTISYRMRRRGLATIALQPEWCVERPGQCNLY